MNFIHPVSSIQRLIRDRDSCVMNLPIKRASVNDNNDNARHSMYTVRHKEEFNIDRFTPVDETKGNG